MCFFFKQKPAYELRISDWSSDVCSSDLSDRRGIGVEPFRGGFPVGRGGLAELDDAFVEELHVFGTAAGRYRGVLQVRVAVHGLGKPFHDDIAGRADGGRAPLQALLRQNAGGGKARRATGGKACEAEAQGLAAREGRQLQSIAVAGHLVVLFFPGQWSGRSEEHTSELP